LKKTLRNIAEIFSGIYIKPGLDGDIYYFQAKHFDKGKFDVSVKPELKFNWNMSQYLLRPGDILLAIKGNNNFAYHYDGIVEKAVASSTFIVIRLLDQRSILPEFFSWYLNHPQTQLFFKDQSRGTDIRSITIRSVKELGVFIPPIQKQKTILELDTLRKREKELLLQIAGLRENLIQKQLLHSIKK